MIETDSVPEFISEPITPDRGSFDPANMVQGLAGVPGGFTWRGEHFAIVELIEHSKISTREGHTASGELYLRREQFTVRLDTDQIATLYIERQPRGASRQRWFLYTLSTPRSEPDSCPPSGGDGP